MKFAEKDFMDMTFYPFVNNGKKRIWEIYPALALDAILDYEFPDDMKEHYHGWGAQQIELLMKFVIIFVDPQSPLLKREKDYFRRRELAFEVLGLGPKNKVRVEIELETKYYGSVVSTYFKTVNDMDFEEWFSLRVAWQDAMAILRTPSMDSEDFAAFQEKKAKIVGSMKEIKKEMLDIEARIFQDDRLQKKILSQTTDEDATYAERFAENLDYTKN